MKLSGKVIAAVVVVIMLGGFLVIVQQSASRPPNYSLTAHDMEVLVNEVLPPGQQQQLATDEEQRKQLAKRLKELLSLAQVAEQEGFLQHADVKSQIDLQTDLVLREAWEKKNTGVTITDEEIAAYHQANPSQWTAFLDANPQYKTQAQGPQGETIKKEFGQIKMLAERARKDGLAGEEGIKLRVLLEKSQALARAYVTDLQKNPEKLVTDADVEQYYREHPEEFEEVHARHILVSTRAEPEDPSAHATPDKAKKDAEKKPKVLTKDEAKKKAQTILDRVHNGEDFAKLAEENSDDASSKVKGGDLGYFAKGSGMVAPFEEAAFRMKAGEVSELVETEFGIHIIKVEERRTKPLDDPQAKQQITEKVRQDKLQKHIEDIAARSKVEVAENFTVNPKPATEMTIPSPASSGAPPEGQPPAAER